MIFYPKWEQCFCIYKSQRLRHICSYLYRLCCGCKIAYAIIFKLFLGLFIYFWLCWVFVSVRGPPLVAASGGHSSSRCAGLPLSWPLLLRSTGSRRAGSVNCGSRAQLLCNLLRSTGSRRAGSVNCGSQAQLLRGMWDLPGPGLEPVSPALAGRFSTTAPGKPAYAILMKLYLNFITSLSNDVLIA